MQTIPNIMTIAGSDSGGGAGIQADLKTIMALGGYGASVITALTAQNGLGVQGIFAPPPEFAVLQLQSILSGFRIDAAKTGMLFSAEIIRALMPHLEKRDFPLVVDPVCVSQSGSKLLEDNAIDALKHYLLPVCDLLTPNLPEASLLADISINSDDDIALAGEKLLNLGARAVLIKGGHAESAIMMTDWLFLPNSSPLPLRQAKVDSTNNHGTGCTLSAAIATELGKGAPLQTAIVRAQRYLNLALRKSWQPGKGCGPVNHAANLSRQET